MSNYKVNLIAISLTVFISLLIIFNNHPSEFKIYLDANSHEFLTLNHSSSKPMTVSDYKVDSESIFINLKISRFK